jgi:hypothetical protein
MSLAYLTISRDAQHVLRKHPQLLWGGAAPCSLSAFLLARKCLQSVVDSFQSLPLALGLSTDQVDDIPTFWAPDLSNPAIKTR